MLARLCHFSILPFHTKYSHDIVAKLMFDCFCEITKYDTQAIRRSASRWLYVALMAKKEMKTGSKFDIRAKAHGKLHESDWSESISRTGELEKNGILCSMQGSKNLDATKESKTSFGDGNGMTGIKTPVKIQINTWGNYCGTNHVWRGSEEVASHPPSSPN